MKKLIWTLAFLLAIIISLIGQSENEYILENLSDIEKEAIHAIVLYPEEVVNAVLEASAHPATIARMGIYQEKTKAQFIDIIEEEDEEQQEKIWNLSRYPGLYEGIVNNDLPLLSTFDTEIVHEGKTLYNDTPETIEAIVSLLITADNYYYDLTSSLPEESQAAFEQLLAVPEVLSLLFEHLDLTVIIGEIYLHNPEYLDYKIDSLQLVLARQNAEELEEWKTVLQSDPAALEELKAVAKEYKGEEQVTYSDDLYAQYDDEVYDFETEIVEVRHYYHYPYWVGYPYWYNYPRWRPYPYWMDWGFYWRSPTDIVIINLPSPIFIDWHLNRPHHFTKYPRWSNHVFDHYYGHRSHGSGIVASVNNWKKNNRAAISDEWLSDKSVRNRYLNEFAKMESKRVIYNRAHADNPQSQEDYIRKNSSQYKRLNEIQESRKRTIDIQSTRKSTSTTTPAKTIERRRIDTQTATKARVIKRANDNHKERWTNTKKVVSPRKKTTTTTKKKTTSKRKKNN